MFPTCLNDDNDDDDREGSLFSDRSEIDIAKGGVRSLAVASRFSGREKKFRRTKNRLRYSERVQAIGVGITRRCADCFADSDCLFELSIVPRVENGQGNRRRGSPFLSSRHRAIFFTETGVYISRRRVARAVPRVK